MQATACEALCLFNSEFWAAIVGAVVGGVIAYFVQLRALREARVARKEARQDENKALAYSLFFKMLSVWNNLAHLKNHVDEARALQVSAGVDRLSTVLRPLANLTDPVRFEPGEMSMLLGLGEADTFNEVMSQDAIHNSILPVWSLYATKRDQLHDAAHSRGLDMTSGIGTLAFEAGSPAELLFYEVTELAVVLAERADKDEAQARNARDLLLRTLNQKLGLNLNFT
ncbi:hypothetical protein ACQKP1_09005 [Allorhizobium sp. NPDC080224]|uniref:hypothetical protein n=1 Tax=Allorhizobium sp. NPDC080224 TaxID=3390547 RepID=UPI003CFFB984